MKFSYQWLKELAGLKETPNQLAKFLALRVFEVESVTPHGKDHILDIKLLPNRAADASGHEGMTREIATLKNSKFKVLRQRRIRLGRKNSKFKESKEKAADYIAVKIENKADSARYTARVMKNVTVGPSPVWIRERLAACGVQSINNVVDAANYVMLECGQPLHIFDFHKLAGGSKKTIIVRRARDREKLLALDDKIYELNRETLVIADEKETIAIAGIKGGKSSGVSEKTTTLILESANFDPARTRAGSALLNLKTDASYRFERGMDPNETTRAIDRLAALIQELAQGVILAGRVDAYPTPRKSLKILLRTTYANRLIGEIIPDKTYETLLRRLGWAYKKRKTGEYMVEPPTVRHDIAIEEDIIEELVRLWGYEHIKAKPAHAPLTPAAPNEMRQWEGRVKDALASQGLSEVYVYAFESARTLGIFESDVTPLFETENPLNPETQYLAAHPSHNFIKTAAENIKEENGVAIFGIMKGFKRAAHPTRETPAEERTYLVLVCAQKGSKDDQSFFELKGALDATFDSLGITDHWYDDALTPDEKEKSKALHPHRTAKVMIGETFVGVLAELRPSTQERLKSKARIVFAQIDFDRLWKLARNEAEFRPPSKFPAVRRDIAVIVPANTKTESVLNAIESSAGELLADIDLFDYFQDETMAPADSKSLAFHLIFQSHERTLTEHEISEFEKKIVSTLLGKGWTVKK